MSLPRFGVTRPVSVNLLMAAFLLAGLYSAGTLRREFFPEIRPDSAMVTLPYPGATPEEIEQSLAIKVEDRLADLDKVEKITTTIAEGGGGIIVQFRENVRDVYRATDEVQRAVDALMDLPEESERIRVTEFEPRLPVIMVSLYGDADEEVMKRAIHRVREDLISIPGMGDVVMMGVRNYEVRVDVDAAAMLEHGLTLPQISDAIRRWMQEVPGGTVRSEVGAIAVRALGVEERSEEIRNIVLRAQPDGTALRVQDIAEVREYFVDQDLLRRFNGERAASLIIFAIGDQDIIKMANAVRAYVDGRSGRAFTQRGVTSRFFGDQQRPAYDLGIRSPHPLPPHTQLALHSDLSRFVEGRLELLGRNAFAGAILVFLTLLLFLNWRVAFWVGVGLVTAIAGTLVFMQVMGITLNLLTMFGLIVVLGLLVDDAIVVAENIQSRHDRGEPSLVAAIKGAEEVHWPVVATVLTSIVAFVPLAFVQGQVGDMLGALPWVVACALAMSLIESLGILPSHMGHSLVKRDKLKSAGRSITQRYERWRDDLILHVIVPGFGRLLDRLLRFRYVTFSAAVAVLIVSLGMIAGGRVPFTFLTSEDSETLIIDVRMPIGTPIERTDELVRRFEAAATAQAETRSVSAIVGQSADIESGRTDAVAGHVAQMFIELHPVELRDRPSQQVIGDIRSAVGPAPEAERVRYSEITGGPGGPDITFNVRGEEIRDIIAAVADIRNTLGEFDGVVDIADDHALGQREVQITLKPGAASLGFTPIDVASQMRAALFGFDAHVFAADREDIDVRVRLDEATRRDLHAVENLWLISPSGQSVPLAEIAELREGTGYTTIRRIDRRRAVTVTADTVPGSNPEEIIGAINLNDLRAAHPNVVIETAGRQEQMQKAFGSLPLGFLAALVGIYVILAMLFSSYVQPLAVMLAIPFGAVGVIWGHWLMGYELTFLSMIGFVALSGVVVNGSLIYMRFFNDRRADGMMLREALVEAGRLRLRPIFLTTITTVLGLTPLMLERSFQARFLIPMAIAIAFGLMGATMVILLVLPCIMVIVDDIKRGLYYLWHGLPRPEPTAEPAPAIE